MHDPGCIFCKIVAGELPCFELYQDQATLAFMDINPVHDGHCLVIPKAHYPSVFDIDAEAITAAARVAARLARAVDATLKPDGLNLIQSNGSGAAQSVPHFHFHILPRRSGDGLLVNWTPRPGDPARIGEIAERIRAALR